MDEQMLAEMQENQAMFVQTAQEASSDGRTLTLHGVYRW
jgi:hypothetical protein